MNIENMLENWHLNEGVPEDVFQEAHLLCSLPLDYISFLKRFNGGEGFINQNYLILWKTEELSLFNKEYEVDEYAPGILLFGSDGGGDGYGFDLRNNAMSIIRVPFIGMELTCAKQIANSFTELFEVLARD